MLPTKDQLTQIAGATSAGALQNIGSIIIGLDRFGADAGLDKPHRLAHYLAQLAHESGGFKYDREIWGPTAAQKRYDTRTDLGNTAAADGDGKLYAGRGPLQITGKANYAAFTKWAGPKGAPDFVAHPDLLNTDPWEGLSPIWFWETRKLNAYCDENNIEQLTKKINGGLNGFDERIRYYTRAALVLLGFSPDDVTGFQRIAQAGGHLPKDEPGKPSQIDGDAGPKTRAAMHMKLAELSAVVALPVTASPVVTEVPVEVPVIPKGSDKPGAARWLAAIPLIGAPLSAFGGLDNTGKLIVAGLTVLAVVAMLLLGERIAMRAKRIIASFES